jgi:hypothetical protein
MACKDCKSYFDGWRSHGPYFPDHAWEILEKQELEVGTHATVTVMEGTAKCRACGQLASFGCSMPDGYGFYAKP